LLHPPAAFARGIVSGFVVDNEGRRVWIWTDAETSFGNSGGTAVNLDGELIGIPTRVTCTGCKSDDINGDNEIDDWESCRPAGGTLGMITPVNLARTLIRRALGSALPESATDGLSPAPSAPGQLGQITVTAFDASGAWLPDGSGASRLAGCVAYQHSDAPATAQSTWYRDDTPISSETISWPAREEHGITCVPLLPTDRSGPLPPGTYVWEITINGETARSASLTVPPAPSEP